MKLARRFRPRSVAALAALALALGTGLGAVQAAPADAQAQLQAWRVQDQAMMGKPEGPSTQAERRQLTEDFRQWVKAHGWPLRSEVGASGAQSAWLLVQHADHDLAWQREALALMETLRPRGEVNLSDLAACGATPRAFFLALSLPRAEARFLEGFARGLFTLADAHGIALAGGDTTAGPLNLCITVMGEAPQGQALLRSGARPGDELWVSGTLGDARLALEVFRGTQSLPGDAFAQVRRAMELPQPRVALGQALRGIASSAIDVSDGLMGDLGHVLKASGVGATIAFEALPRSDVLAGQDLALQQECLLAGGDDYELVFTAPPQRHQAVLDAAARAGTPVRCVGRIRAEPGLEVLDAHGAPLALRFASFDHFKS